MHFKSLALPFLLLAIATSSYAQTPSSAPAVHPTASKTAKKPAQAESALTAVQTREIDRYVTAEMARQSIPGATVGVYRHGKMVFARGYGYANLEWHIKMQPDTMMQSGSVGKQFTATAVMMLVEQGKVGLEDSIRKYFPEGPESWDAIKVKNLLSHSSGLGEFEDAVRNKPGAIFDLRADFTEDQLVQKTASLPLDSSPGEKFAYRNTNYMLLGILIHRVTGKFYGDYMQEHIFQPLGMHATRIISDRDIVPNRAAGYEIDGNVLKNQEPVSATFNSTGDGTLYFNLPDLEKWDRAQYGDTILSKSMKDIMWTPFILNDGKPNSGRYGFGFFINQINGHRLIEHTGSWQGFTSIVSRYVDDELSVVVLLNLDEYHSKPQNMERVVAGIVEPALMPAVSKPIEDDKPAVADTFRKLLTDITEGRDASHYFAPGASYHFDAGDAARVKFDLPPDWRNTGMELILRKDEGGVLISRYRAGPADNRRVLTIMTTPDGSVKWYSIGADPDNR